MYRLAAIVALVFALPLWSSAAQARHVDQGCDTPHGGSGPRQIDYYEPMGQSFYPTEAIHAGIELYIEDGGPPGDPQVTIKLRRDTISGSVVSGTTVTRTYSGNGWVYFQFPAPVNLIPGNCYVIEISAPDARGFVYETGNNCCPGHAWIFGNEWSQDFYFHTYIVDGACCFMDGTCRVRTEDDCDHEGGDYEGDETDCVPNPCPQPHSCCFTDGSCHMYTQIMCTVMGGYLWLDGEDCDPNPCPQPGACCFADGSCQERLEDDCAQAGGYLWLDGEDCDPNPCPQPGACCFADGSCQERLEDDCAQAGGYLWLDGEDCDPNPCPQPGACCFANGSCQELAEDACTQAGGDYWLADEVCSPNPCDQPPPEVPCEDCGPGDHWVDQCPAGSDVVPASVGLVGIDLDLDCIEDMTMNMIPCPAPENMLLISRSDPLDDSQYFPGLRPVDGHLDVIDTEITFLCLEGDGMILRAGACQGQGDTLSASLGAIAEMPADPSLANSFFNVFFEIDRGGGQYAYNHEPLLIESIIDCVPPRVGYIHLEGCLPLYSDPVDGQLVANLTRAQHVVYPEPHAVCCYGEGECVVTDMETCFAELHGNFHPHWLTCDPNPCPPPSGECDNMETDLWTFGHDHANYDGTWVAEYSTNDWHSPARSIRTSLHGGGDVGLDADLTYGTRTFSVSDVDSVESMSVWFNSMGVTGASARMAACYVEVSALDAAEEELDSQIYCVIVNDNMGQTWESMPDWIYQESRTDEYEPGAPDYSREWDGSIQPPPGWWYKLKVLPSVDLDVDWQQVEFLKIRLVARGVFLYGNSVGIYWDDFCINEGSATRFDWADHNVGNCVLTVTDQGIIGFMDDTQAEGSGFIYPAGGLNNLYIGSLWVGESEEYVANRDYSPEPIKEWIVSSLPPGYVSINDSGWIYGDANSDQDIHTSYTDLAASEPRGLFVDQDSWAFAAPGPADDFVIINYRIRNEGAAAMESVYVGCFLDIDIGADYTDDTGSTDQAKRLVYMTDASGVHVGVSLLQDAAGQEPPLANLTLISNSMCDPYYIYDETKYRLLSAAGSDYVLPDAPTPGDYRVLASAGPIALGTDQDTLVTFAIMGGHSVSQLRGAIATAEVIVEQGIDDVPPPGFVPDVTRLLPSRPNPFGHAAVIQFELAHSGPVSLAIYDLEGRLVRTLTERQLSAKRYTLVWDGRDDSGRDVANGVYFLRLDTDQTQVSRRLIRLR